jgi:hypothetical protein
MRARATALIQSQQSQKPLSVAERIQPLLAGLLSDVPARPMKRPNSSRSASCVAFIGWRFDRTEESTKARASGFFSFN